MKQRRYIVLAACMGFFFLCAGVAEATKPRERLVKTADDPKVFLVIQHKKIHIPTEEIFKAGKYAWNDIEIVSQKEMSGIADMTLIKSVLDAKVYRIVDGKKQHIPDGKTFVSAGHDWGDVIFLPQVQVDFYVEEPYSSVAAQPTQSTEEPGAEENIRVQVFIEGDKRVKLGNVANFLSSYPKVEIHDVNIHGDVVGCLKKTYYGARHSFIYKNKKLTILNSINPNLELPDDCLSGINDLGQAVGSSDYKEGLSESFRWDNGKVTKLGMLPGGKRSRAEDINNHGQIVGMSAVGWYNGSEEAHAFLWDTGGMKDLGYYNDNEHFQTWAMDINDHGYVIGISNMQHAFVWKDEKMSPLVSLLPKYSPEDGMLYDVYGFEEDGTVKTKLVKSFMVKEVKNGKEVLSQRHEYRDVTIQIPN